MNQAGTGNTAIGNSSLSSTVNGNGNTALGNETLVWNLNGSNNTAVGFRALMENTTGSPNTAIGAYALEANTTGNENIALGDGALRGNVSGTWNIAVGPEAGSTILNTSHNIHIGHTGVATDSGVLRIGNSLSQTTAFIAGIRGVTTIANNAIPVVIDSNGQLGTISSSIRFKEDVRDLGGVSSRIFQLRPVSFRYKGQMGNAHYGLIAEEVDQVMPELAVHGKDGQIETVAYHELPPLLLSEVQKQQKAIERLEVDNADLRQQLAEIRALLLRR